MATDPASEAATGSTATKLKLDPPEALQSVAPAEAAGLVPLKAEETTELDKRVSQFVDELAALDSNSPEFGKKVDQLTAMGRKEIAEAAGASNRFLDRPVKAIDQAGQVDRHQPPRVLRIGIEGIDPLQRLLKGGQSSAHRIDFGLGGGGKGSARSIEIGIEALNHLAVREVG